MQKKQILGLQELSSGAVCQPHCYLQRFIGSAKHNCGETAWKPPITPPQNSQTGNLPLGKNKTRDQKQWELVLVSASAIMTSQSMGREMPPAELDTAEHIVPNMSISIDISYFSPPSHNLSSLSESDLYPPRQVVRLHHQNIKFRRISRQCIGSQHLPHIVLQIRLKPSHAFASSIAKNETPSPLPLWFIELSKWSQGPRRTWSWKVELWYLGQEHTCVSTTD